MNVLKNVKISAELLAKDKIKQQIKELKQQKVRGKALSLQKKQLKEAEFSAIDARVDIKLISMVLKQGDLIESFLLRILNRYII